LAQKYVWLQIKKDYIKRQIITVFSLNGSDLFVQ
jgi:hypothetical protein